MMRYDKIISIFDSRIQRSLRKIQRKNRSADLLAAVQQYSAVVMPAIRSYVLVAQLLRKPCVDLIINFF